MTGASYPITGIGSFTVAKDSSLSRIKVDSVMSIALPFFLLTISGSHHFVDAGQQNIVEALGYTSLIASVINGMIRKKTCASRDWAFALVIIVLLLPSFLLEELVLYRKASFLLATAVLVCTAVFSRGLIFDRDEITLAVFGIILGVIVSFMLSIYDGSAVGALGNFDGGVLYKNYFAGDMLCILLGAASLSAHESRMTVGRLFIVCTALAMVLASGSKGAMLLVGVFALVMLLQAFYSMNSRTERMLIALLAIGISIPLLLFFLNWTSDVETYQYRVRGLQNYLAYVNGDVKHVAIGNSALLYSGRAGYAMYFRELTGWNGSIEFAWLNVLMKHGLLGVVAYFAIFVRLFLLAKQCHGAKGRYAIAILLTLLLSSFVESYMETMHSVVGPFCFMLANGLIGPASANGNKTEPRA